MAVPGELLPATVNEIHGLIKTESGHKPVYFWLHNGFKTLDKAPKDWTFETSERTGNYCSFRLTEMIRPGLCEGIILTPDTVGRWQDRVKPLVEKHGWPYFSQLAYPGVIRLETWQANSARMVAPDPWKQGYFVYCDSLCSRPSPWNDPEDDRNGSPHEESVSPSRSRSREGRVVRIVPDVAPQAYTHIFQFLSEAEPPLRVQPGKTFRWSVRIRTQNISDAQSTPTGSLRYPIAGQDQGAVVFIVWFASNGHQISQNYVVRLTGTHDWQTCCGVATAPPNTVSAAIYLASGRPTARRSSPRSRSRPKATTPSGLLNGSFEKFTRPH